MPKACHDCFHLYNFNRGHCYCAHFIHGCILSLSQCEFEALSICKIYACAFGQLPSAYGNMQDIDGSEICDEFITFEYIHQYVW